MFALLRSTAPVVAALIAVASLTACAPDASDTPAATGSASALPTPIETTGAESSASPTAAGVRIPTDCELLLTVAVLDQLEGVPLNDPAFAPNGPQSDGSLICVWADPGADTTGLTTTISRMLRGPALDLMNTLVDDEGYTCYTPSGGTRCEKQWQNDTYPVTDGRTLFWRDDILIDTRYSNLAPTGYTDAIIDYLFG